MTTITIINDIIKCPECKSRKIKQIHPDENILYCTECGLVLNELPYYIDTTKVDTHILPTYIETLKWIAWDKKWEPLIKK